jgi:hypothetical protein
VALSPDQWLARLTKAMDDRAARLALLRSYMDGNAPLPEGAEGCRDAYKDFQRKARTNFGELVVEAVTERIIPAGFTLNGEDQDDDQIRAIWKRNRLKIGFADVLRDMVGLSAGYMIVGEAEKGRALVTCERPEQVITEQAPNRPDQVRAGLKVFRDEVDGFDVAKLHVPGLVRTYYRPLRGTSGALQSAMRVQGDWTLAGDDETGLKFVPVFPFVNRGGLGEFEPHTDILDRINWNILQRLVITAMQAYRQRALASKDGEPLPAVDEDGNEIDYDKMFSASPGALWELPPGFEVWESSQTDIQGILAANKHDLGHLAAVTRTPMPTMMPGGENQSAEGAAFAREGLVFKAIDRRDRADASLSLALGAALAIENGFDMPVEGVECLWEPAERRSLQERADAASKAQDVPWRDRMTDIWGYTADRVDKMESNRAADALNASLSAPFQAPQAPVSGQQPPA